MSKRLVAITILTFLSASVMTGAFRIQSVRALPSPQRLDNLVITTSDLEAAASRLAQWKNSCGIPSKVLNVSWIYSHYSGIDEPEKIRNCIRDYYWNFQIKYVTIFGDTDKVPIRYAYVPDTDETLVPTDLYYADLNNTWDDNGDGLYADLGNDTIEGVPEVSVGRIPASFDYTAEDAVTKIIEYKDNFKPSESWVSRIVLAAGESDENMATSLSEFISWYVSNNFVKNIVKLYQSSGNLTNSALASQIDEGCFFLNFVGHSGGGLFETLHLLPECWILGPHPWNPLDFEKFNYQDAMSRTNGRKLPVVVTMSCLSAKVDWTGIFGGECLGEYFVMNPDGGAIAYFGATGIAWGSDSPYYLMPEMNLRVYRAFRTGHTSLGTMWSESVSRYIENHGLNEAFYNNGTFLGYLDEKTVMEFILLGDPTLRIYDGPRTLKVPEDYATIQSAVNDAYEGDTVYAKNGMYYEHLVVNKTINLRGESRESTIVDGNDLKDVLIITADNVNVSGFTFQRAESSPGSCIKLDHVSGANISSNIARDSNLGHGIFLLSSTMNTVTNNLIINNTGHDCSICLYGSSQNTLSANTVVNPYDVAMGSILLAYGSSYNTLLCNVVLGTSQIGIRLYGSDSSSNRVIANRIENHWHGVQLLGSSSNVFYHNSIINNTDQVYDPGYLTTWSNGYPSGGNYWSDYNGTDLFMGTYQNESGNDGVGDNPYAINANDTDNYPLMSPWSPPDVAALNVSYSKTIVGQSFCTNITALFKNQGSKIEQLNVSFYLSDVLILNQAFLLKGGDGFTYSYVWNSSSVAKGNYTSCVSVCCLENENDFTGNYLNGDSIFITIPGDLKADKIVDIYDAILLSKSFNDVPNSPHWNPNADINSDNVVDIYDAIILASHFEESWL